MDGARPTNRVTRYSRGSAERPGEAAWTPPPRLGPRPAGHRAPAPARGRLGVRARGPRPALRPSDAHVRPPPPPRVPPGTAHLVPRARRPESGSRGPARWAAAGKRLLPSAPAGARPPRPQSPGQPAGTAPHALGAGDASVTPAGGRWAPGRSLHVAYSPCGHRAATPARPPGAGWLMRCLRFVVCGEFRGSSN